MAQAGPSARTPARSSARSARLLAGLLLGSGVAHFAAPKPFDAIVPRSLPGTPRAWTYASGVAELAIGAAVALPRTRRVGAQAAAGLFVAVFPANVKMAVDWRDHPAPLRAAAIGRLPLQLPLVLWARRVGLAGR
ncbi:MauE/DoxX family redox-associated membrane protein [Kitasatospora sp. NPDC048540]|uniref:DoxX family protein n=1 Tax=Kitasatospora sp. NPDC048540 TaxID=3155634 RepID=UPI0033F7D8C1